MIGWQNKEHISLEWKELNRVSTHKKESAKYFGLMRKEAKMKRKIFIFIFGKRENIKNILVFFFFFFFFIFLKIFFFFFLN